MADNEGVLLRAVPWFVWLPSPFLETPRGWLQLTLILYHFLHVHQAVARVYT